MKLFIRKKTTWINFISSVAELRAFQDNYIPNTKLLIGDISQFNKSMLNMLLKFLEDNQHIDCYSSKDVADKVLLSRFAEVEKERIKLDYVPSTQDFLESSKDFNAIGTFLPHIDPNYQLRLVGAQNYLVEILTSLK